MKRITHKELMVIEQLAAEILDDPPPTEREYDDFYAMLLDHGVRPLGF